MRRIPSSWLVCLAVFVLWFAPGLSAAEGTLAEYLPDGALGSLEMANLSALIERIEQSLLPEWIGGSDAYRRWADSPDGRRFRGGQAILEGQLGIDLWTLIKRVAGEQMFLAIYPPGENRTDPDAVLLVRLADDQIGPLLKEKLTPFVGLASEQIQAEERNGSWRLWSRDGKLHVVLRERWVIASNDTARLESVFKAVTNPDTPLENTLAEAPAWKNLSLKVGSDETWLQFCVDLQRIHQLRSKERLFSSRMDNPLASLLAGGLMECVALAPRLHGALTVGHSDFSLNMVVEQPVRELSVAHQALFPARENQPASHTPSVPRLLASLELSRDWASWYRHREDLHEARVLPEFDKFETGLATFLPGKDFAEDVLGLLNPSLTILVARQTYPHLKGQPGVQLPAVAVLLDLKDPQKGADVFNLFFQTITSISNIEAGKYGRYPWVLGSESHRGVQVSFARYLQTPEGQDLPLVYNFQPASAVVGQKFIASTSLELCRDLIDALQKPAASERAVSGPAINLELTLSPQGLADLLEANSSALQAAGLQAGRTAEEVERDIQAGLGFLRHLNRWQLRTLVHDKAVEWRLTGSWD